MIVNHIAESEHNGYDLIVSMPSSYNISHMIAKRLASKFKAPHEANILRKITVDEAFRLLDRADVSVEETKSIDFRIKVQAKEVGLYGNFSLKGIPASLRNVLPPLVLDSPPTLHYQPLRVLLVDDLIASGTTLTTAVKIISQQYPYADIHAVCLFSSIG